MICGKNHEIADTLQIGAFEGDRPVGRASFGAEGPGRILHELVALPQAPPASRGPGSLVSSLRGNSPRPDRRGSYCPR